MATRARRVVKKTGAPNVPPVTARTEHTVLSGCGKGIPVRVSHHDYRAVQYEFYIPEAIWPLNSVQTFITRLQSVVFGATVFRGLIGIWQRQPESTCIYRVIVPHNQLDANATRLVLHQEIGRLMAELSTSLQHVQQAFMFTETEIRATLTSDLVRI